MKLKDFIIEAKLAGYAGNAENQKHTFPDGSVGFKFSSDHFEYLDRFYGTNPFSGVEHVFDKENTLIWVMNYFGGVDSEKADLQAVYSFLREAMLLISPEYPFRGPKEYQKNQYKYRNHQEGTIERFSGIENIYYNNALVYTLHYHGGMLEVIV